MSCSCTTGVRGPRAFLPAPLSQGSWRVAWCRSPCVRRPPTEVLLHVDREFAAAHRLPFYDGPCKRLHGHNYRLRVTLAGRPSPQDGMVRDFDEVKRKVWDTCLVALDHH